MNDWVCGEMPEVGRVGGLEQEGRTGRTREGAPGGVEPWVVEQANGGYIGGPRSTPMVHVCVCVCDVYMYHAMQPCRHLHV